MTAKNWILGISAYYHDSAAALLCNGEIVAAAHEERFSRKKQDAGFPVQAVHYLLSEAGISIADLSVVAYYEKPLIKFERLLETYHSVAPRGLSSFLAAMPVWIHEKMNLRKNMLDELAAMGIQTKKSAPLMVFPEHHLSHAASAFYPSPFEESAILTIDGVGEWDTTVIAHGKGNAITKLRQLQFPHSLGLLYSAFTYYCGFRVNSGEYKLMGLSPYGNPFSDQYKRFVDLIKTHMVDIREDGSFLLNLKYFDFLTELRMCNEPEWEKLFGIPLRTSEGPIDEGYMNLSLAIQKVTEEIIVLLAGTARKITGSRNLTLAGGVALNCVANARILEAKIFDKLWIQPAAGDAGGALGAAFAAYHIWQGNPRQVNLQEQDKMKGAFLGPSFTDRDIQTLSHKYDAKSEAFAWPDLYTRVAALIAEGNVIGWFQGRMEWGPRALGNRSIIADARNTEMQKKLNLKIKFREGFRPFAPSVLSEYQSEYFGLDAASPYMLMIGQVIPARLNPKPEGYHEMALYDRLYFTRSDIPSITHIDDSARIQTVHKETNPHYWALIQEFHKQTGYGLVVNTSFNVRGEPIVCTPEDAYRCFMRTEMDYLVINNCLFAKQVQPVLVVNDSFESD